MEVNKPRCVNCHLKIKEKANSCHENHSIESQWWPGLSHILPIVVLIVANDNSNNNGDNSENKLT